MPVTRAPQTLAMPLRIAGGRLATLQQGSVGDISQSVAVLLSTRPGERAANPDYGLPDPVFGGLSVSEVAETIRTWEERAAPAVVDEISRGVVDAATVIPNTSTSEVNL